MSDGYTYDVEVENDDEIVWEIQELKRELDSCEDRQRRKSIIKDIDILVQRMTDEEYKNNIVKEFSYEVKSYITGL
jgi:hypothetical protein